MHLIHVIILALESPVIRSKSIAWTRDLVQTTSNIIYFHIRGLNSKTNFQKCPNFQNYNQILELMFLWVWHPNPWDSVFLYGKPAVNRQPGYRRETRRASRNWPSLQKKQENSNKKKSARN